MKTFKLIYKTGGPMKFVILFCSISIIAFSCVNPLFPTYNSGELEIVSTSFVDSATVNEDDSITITIRYDLGRNYKEGTLADFSIVSICDTSDIGWTTSLDSLNSREGTKQVKFRAGYNGIKCDYMGVPGYLVFEPEISFKYEDKKYQRISSDMRYHLFVFEN